MILERAACAIAVDGKRQMEVYRDQTVSVRLTNRGPPVLDVRRRLQGARDDVVSSKVWPGGMGVWERNMSIGPDTSILVSIG